MWARDVLPSPRQGGKRGSEPGEMPSPQEVIASCCRTCGSGGGCCQQKPRGG